MRLKTWTVVIADEDGEFYGIDGHHAPRTLLRAIKEEFSLFVRGDIIPHGNTWGEWSSMVTQGWWTKVSRDDPATWRDRERDMMENEGGWYYEWDDLYFVCQEGDAGAVLATYWQT